MSEVDLGSGSNADSVVVSAGFPIRSIANVLRFSASQDFSVPSEFSGKCLYITGCGAGGGGGGYHDGAYNSKSWGCGGAGAASAFRIPLAAKAGDVIRVTVGAGGIAATNSNNSTGSDGGSTTIENITAMNESRFGELTKFIAIIVLQGGEKGRYNNFTNKAAVQWNSPLGGKINGIFDTFVDIGFVIKGGNGGRGGAYYGSSWGSGNENPAAYSSSGASNGEVVRSILFDNAFQDGSNWQDGGGGGGSLFAADGFGFGGKGRSYSDSATHGKDGFALLEWD